MNRINHIMLSKNVQAVLKKDYSVHIDFEDGKGLSHSLLRATAPHFNKIVNHFNGRVDNKKVIVYSY